MNDSSEMLVDGDFLLQDIGIDQKLSTHSSIMAIVCNEPLNSYLSWL